MADMEHSDKHKKHKPPTAGRKADKKDAKKKTEVDQSTLTARERNPKAFAIAKPVKAERRFRRTMDIKSKSYKVPTVDRTPIRPAPTVVAIVGPPKVGKTTLLRGLIKNFTRQKLTSINGPVTLITGKKKRVTFIECDNDINNMMDIAKITDLALLVIDAKSGLEMETLEFLNICQIHGMPRLISVLTHLDLYKNQHSLSKQKKFLKKRVATEIPKCEKMFYLSGLLWGGYLKNEILNLCRFITVIKYEPSSWKKTHPYVFVDRVEDITDEEKLSRDPDCNRNVCLYGYARGGNLKKNTYYHIPGCGDYIIKNIHFLPDPCPLPNKLKQRSLNEKERLVYAPMSGVGGIVYDKDAVYIEMKEDANQVAMPKETDKLLQSMVSIQHPLDEKIKAASLQLYPGQQPTIEGEDDSDDDYLNEEDKSDKDDKSDDDESDKDDGFGSHDSDEEDANSDRDVEDSMSKGKKRKVRFADEVENDGDSSEDDESVKSDGGGPSKKKQKLAESSDEEDETHLGQVKWKENLVQRAADDFYQRQKESKSLQKIVYGQRDNFKEKDSDDSDEENELGNLFRVAKHEKEKKSKQKNDYADSTKFIITNQRDWSAEENLDLIKDCFVTGKWGDDADAATLLKEDDEVFGDFEDVEAGTVHKGKEVESAGENGEKEAQPEDEEMVVQQEKARKERYLEKKKKIKEEFNQMFDDSHDRAYHDELKMEADVQGELNKTEFEGMDDDVRVQFEGFRPGLYVRLEVEEMPCEFVKNFQPSYPIIVGSLLKGEEQMGFLQARFKCHRFYRRGEKKLILKSGDPLILSIGWRRIQTAPIYYTVDHNLRCRYLKYTPEHLHCMAAFWGPVTQQKAGIVGVQTVHEISSNFRIAGVGSISEVNKVTNILKKLKLVGSPRNIYKKTAFIKDMFSTPREVCKYEGAAITTVSGIRGQIKKAQRHPPGDFRATFEDKILMSDLVFLRTWVSVDVPQFCIPVTSLLLPPEQKSKWKGSRTLGTIRYEENIPVPVNQDSNYVPIKRTLKMFAPLRIPKDVQKMLPFKSKIIHKHKKKMDPENERIAVIKEPREREISKMLTMLKSVHAMKMKTVRKATRERAKAHHKELHEKEEIHAKKVQEMKKRIMKNKTRGKPNSGKLPKFPKEAPAQS